MSFFYHFDGLSGNRVSAFVFCSVYLDVWNIWELLPWFLQMMCTLVMELVILFDALFIWLSEIYVWDLCLHATNAALHLMTIFWRNCLQRKDYSQQQVPIFHLDGHCAFRKRLLYGCILIGLFSSLVDSLHCRLVRYRVCIKSKKAWTSLLYFLQITGTMASRSVSIQRLKTFINDMCVK